MSAAPSTVNWTGKSGRQYLYYIFPRKQPFDPTAPGNYIHAKMVNGMWVAVYIGETGDLNQRLSNHEKQECVDANGATHLHVHASSADEAVRRVEESDLIALHQPPCNIKGIAKSLYTSK